MTGEIAGYVMETLLEIGALDVFYTPIYMKKNRPGIKLSILCEDETLSRIQQAIFKETTTLGIRMYKTSRVCMEREWLAVNTPYGEVRIKKAQYGDVIKYAPEYEDCKRCAKQGEVAIQTVYQAALQHFHNLHEIK